MNLCSNIIIVSANTDVVLLQNNSDGRLFAVVRNILSSTGSLELSMHCRKYVVRYLTDLSEVCMCTVGNMFLNSGHKEVKGNIGYGPRL